MDTKKHIFKIEQKIPLKGWEWAETAEMTWDEAIQRAGNLLSPAIEGMNGKGKAFSVRIAILRTKKHWVYIPQWDD